MQINVHKDPDQIMTLIQPTWEVIFNINLDQSITVDTIDDWLGSVLKIDLADIDNKTAVTQNETSQFTEAFCWRILLLTRSLLQLVRLPYFDLGSIVKVERDTLETTKWKVTLRLVKIENMSKSLYQSIIRSSMQIIFEMLDKEKTTEHINTLYTLIDTQVLKPFIRSVGAGKSTMPVLSAAHQRNIPFIHLGSSVYQLGWGSKSKRIQRSGIELDSAIGAELSHNKVRSSQLFRMAGLPVPEHGVTTEENSAITIAHSIGWPIVVKPADTDRGEGVTIGIKDDKELLDAFHAAQTLSKSKQVIIEREVEGVCYRLFVAKGKLLYAMKRLPKSVTGDGQKSVSQLISEANKHEAAKPPWLRDTLYPDDTLAINALAKSGFSLESVPEKGTLAPLRMIESTAAGGSYEDATDSVHPDNLDIALRAVEVCGLSVAGVDIITTDIHIPWHQNTTILNEINYTPLMGGNEISKTYVPLFLKQIIIDDGRIPIEVVVGGDEAMTMALEKQKTLTNKGINSFLTSHSITLHHKDSQEMMLSFQSLYKRCQALLLNKQVETIVLVIQTDELLYTGLPFDQIRSISIVDNKIKFRSTHHKDVATARFTDICTQLNALLK